jgi:hypothetical protein
MAAASTIERRKDRRYIVHLPVRYRVSERGSMPFAGSGMTCEMSITGLSFRCRRVLPVGSHIELLIEWPSRRDEGQQVEMQVTGFVVRANGGKAGIRVTSHRFLEQQVAAPMAATA